MLTVVKHFPVVLDVETLEEDPVAVIVLLPLVVLHSVSHFLGVAGEMFGHVGRVGLFGWRVLCPVVLVEDLVPHGGVPKL